MQALFAHNLLNLGVWLASLLIWRVMEVGVVRFVEILVLYFA